MSNFLKTCSLCEETKELKQFSRAPRNKDGLKNFCKVCEKNANQAYYNEKRIKQLERVKKWQAENEEKYKQYQDFYRKNKNNKQNNEQP